MHYATAQKPITAAEYFWDTDPGEGRGKTVSIGSSADSVHFQFTASVSGLPAGFHSLYLRVRGDSLKWSLTEQENVFIYQTFLANPPSITNAEYFWDADPGEGSGKVIAVNTASDSVNLTAVLPTAGLATGFHALYVRTKAANGDWAMVEQRETYIYQNISVSAPDIVAAEYFWDTDPGEGSGKPITVSKVSDSVQITSVIPTTGLPQGFHALYVRTKDANGKWALVEQRETYVYQNLPSVAPNIIAAEYFWDADPGENKGHNITVSNPADSVQLVPSVTVNVPQGFHQLYVRSEDANKHWSLVDQRTLYITSYAAKQDSIINAAEYFIDTDPGEGKATPIAVSTPADSIKQAFTINIPANIDTGYHLVFVRTRTSHGLWGVVESAEIHVGKNSLPISLLYFRAVMQKGGVNLDWETTSEINSSLFEVKRMAGNGAFVPVATIAAAGNSSVPQYYQAQDGNPPTGPLFYRLKETDKDGVVTYSLIVEVDNNRIDSPKLYPNPAKTTVHIELPLLTHATTLVIYNNLGQAVIEKSIAEGTSAFDVDVSRLAVGKYYAVLISKNGSRSTLNFTRQ
jgi:hypothetical protein